MKLVNVQEMKQLDQLATAEYAVPGILLMDNAAQAVADAVNDSLDELDGESVVVFGGGGNNGGDGFGAARWLQNYGAKVRVFVVGKELEAVTGDAAAELAML
ncbi:NAD(P)H-hydrate epimerase, partial [Phascolarctobacterium succinatutens]|uniref:NAD(P)H-hydrate epimerase n=1 Tax=Phascolarctobacterium succinatutens TaxID=626940 RepID=UPI0026F1F3EF